MPNPCPKCGYTNSRPLPDCPKCGINFEGYRRHLEHERRSLASPQKGAFLENVDRLYVQQNEDALRIFTGWPTCNHYTLMTENGDLHGGLAERKGGVAGIFSRLLFKTHRPLQIDIALGNGESIASLTRPFFWFFSEIMVRNQQGHRIGGVCQRFGIFRRTYTLHGPNGQWFATVKSTILGGKTIGDMVMGNDTFSSFDGQDRETGASIYRSWNGAINRLFTDEDTFAIEFLKDWSPEQKLTFLAAAISIDFDFYESKPGLAERAGITSSVVPSILSKLFSSKNDD